jgi:N6-adenosine-specific RNA methylase IME4
VIEDFFTDDYEPDVLRTSNVAHSRKPVETRERIIKLCGDLPRIEIFATENVKEWDNWGKDGFFTEDEPDLLQ